MVYEKKCPNCGLVFRTARENQTYCCKSCGNIGRRKNDKGEHDTSLEWVKDTEFGKWVCPYNQGVGCYDRNCITCGWNPEVAKARLDKYLGVDHEG
jgi:uncharacterized C2H2 Zn-finger protein